MFRGRATRRPSGGCGVDLRHVGRDEIALFDVKTNEVSMPVRVGLGAIHRRVAPLNQLFGEPQREVAPVRQGAKLEARDTDVAPHWTLREPRIEVGPVVPANSFAE